MFTLAGTIITTACFPIITVKKNYVWLVNLVNMLSLLFHYIQWVIVSGLCFIYIVHEDWMHERFPDTTKVRKIALSKCNTM